MAKVSFDGTTKIITVTQAPVADLVELDVRTEIYKEWVDWTKLNPQYLFAFRFVGGDPLSAVKNLGITFFLINGWRIRPYEASHRLLLTGNLYTDPSGSSPVVNTIGTYSVVVEYSVSNLVDSTLIQLPEIQQASYQNQVVIDVVDGFSGTAYPTGTRQRPSNNLVDAKTIAISRGLSNFYINSPLTIDNGEDVSDYTFIGHDASDSLLTFNAGSITNGTGFQGVSITGTLGVGNSHFKECLLDNVYGLNGNITSSTLKGVLHLAGNTDISFAQCYDGVNPGSVEIDMGGSGRKVELRDYFGGLLVSNKTGSEQLTVNFSAGRLAIANTVTGGSIVVRGVGEISTNLGTIPVNDSGLVNYDKFTGTTHRLIEGLRPHHTATGTIYYWDPINGNDMHDGKRPDTACLTFAHIHDNLVVDWGHDTIFCFHGNNTGVTETSENIQLSKNYTFLRGPGRAFKINAANNSIPAIRMTGEGGEVSKVFVATSNTNPNPVIVSNNNFALIQNVWIADSNNGIEISGGDYSIIKEIKSHHNTGYGVRVTGTSKHTDIDSCHIGNNGGDGLVIDPDAGAHEVNIIGSTIIHKNGGYGVNIQSNAEGVIINDSVEIFNNILGQVNDFGTNTWDNSYKEGWTIEEKNQIRNRIGIDGASSVSNVVPTLATVDSIWNAAASGYNSAGTLGQKLNGAGTAGDPWTADLSGYGVGTAGKIINDIPAGNTAILNAVSASGADAAQSVWNTIVESGMTAEELLRLLVSVAASNAEGLESASPIFKSLDGTKNRITANYNNGARTITGRDGT